MRRIAPRLRHQFAGPSPRRRISLILLLLAAFSFVGTSAWAYWTTTGSGTGSAATGTLNAPTSPIAAYTAGSSTVAVSWTASSGTTVPSGYYVSRIRNSDSVSFPACSTGPGFLTSGVTCNDTSAPDGTFHYTVTAVYLSWTATSTASNNVTVTVDVTPPTVTINQAAGQADPTNSGTVVFTAVFSEPVTGFTDTAVAITGTAGGTKTVVVSGTGPTYTVTVSGATGNGTVIASIGASTVLDLAGNANTASTSTDNMVTLDTLAPTVTNVTSPTSDGSYKAGVVIPVTVAFSEPVNVAGTPQLTLSTGTPATTAVNYTSGTGTSTLTFNYTVVAGNTSADLAYATTTALVLSGGTIRDAATNNAALTLASPGSAGSLSFNKNLVIDTTAPTVSSIGRAGASQSVKAGPLSWTVTFSEPVNGVTTSNFALVTSGTGGTAPTITGVTPSAGPSATWTVATSETGTTGTNSGSIGLNLANGTGIQDGATNASATSAFTGQTYLFDTTAPTLSSINIAAASPTKASSLSWTVTFSESVTGVAASNFAAVKGANVTGTPGTPVVTGSGTNWTVTVSTAGVTGANTLNTIGLNLTNGTGIQDGATNASATSTFTGQTYVFDTTAPTVSSITTTNAGGTAGKPEVNDTVSFTYSELMSPASLYDGWSTASQPDVTNATVTFNDSTTQGNNGTNKDFDSFNVTVAGHTLAIGGGIQMDGNIVPTQNGSYSFTARLRYSEVSSKSVVTVTLTSLNAGGTSTVGTAAAGTVTWSPGSGATDVAGNIFNVGTPVATSVRPF